MPGVAPQACRSAVCICCSPANQLVGQENQGWTQAKFLLGNERTGIVAVGQTKVRLTLAKEYPRQTRLGTATLLDDPIFASRLAELENELLALELVQLWVAAGSADGKPNPVSSILKLRGTELQQAVTELLVDIAGPNSVAREADAPDWARRSTATYLNYRKTSIYGGSNEVQRSIVASTILGL